MKRLIALMLVLGLTACTTTVQEEELAISNEEVEKPAAVEVEQPQESRGVPAPEITHLWDNKDDANESFAEHCAQTYTLFERDLENPYWDKSLSELLNSEEVRSEFPQFEAELDAYATHFELDQRPFILNAMCDFDDELYLGLLAGEVGEYLYVSRLDENMAPQFSDPFGGLYDGAYWLTRMDFWFPESLVVWLPFGDAGHVGWRVYEMNPDTLVWQKAEDCGMSYYDEYGESSETPMVSCDMEFTGPAQ